MSSCAPLGPVRPSPVSPHPATWFVPCCLLVPTEAKFRDIPSHGAAAHRSLLPARAVCPGPSGRRGAGEARSPLLLLPTLLAAVVGVAPARLRARPRAAAVVGPFLFRGALKFSQVKGPSPWEGRAAHQRSGGT